MTENKKKSLDKYKDLMGKKRSEISNGDIIFNSDKGNESGVCDRCKGRGYVVVKGKTEVCDVCKGKNRQVVGNVMDKEQSVEIDMSKLQIPDFYIERDFDPTVLKKDENLHLNIRNDMLMDFYIKELQKIHDYFVMGKRLENSYIIMAPQGNAKSHLVYSCMKLAKEKGFTVSPYYDTNEIYKMFYNDDTELNNIFNVDVCFIKMIPAFLSKKDTQAVKYVLDKRAKRNLPTVVTSRFNMGYIKDIEPHLTNNFGIKSVEVGDYSKLKEVLGVYPKDYGNYRK